MNLLYSYPVEIAMRYHAPSESMLGETGDGMQALGGWRILWLIPRMIIIF